MSAGTAKLDRPPSSGSAPRTTDITHRILELIDGDSNIFLTGPGGTGKSYTIHQIYRHCKSRGKTVYVTAMTGVAAINLMNAHSILDDEGNVTTTQFTDPVSTLHKWAGIQLGDGNAEALYATANRFKATRQRWTSTDILVIDEVSMLSRHLFEKLDEVGRRMRRSVEPFGGIQLVLSGDFLQLPPVIKGSEVDPDDPNKSGWIFTTELWDSLSFTEVILEEPRRYPDIDYFNLLMRIRKQEQTDEDVETLRSRYRAYLEYLESLEGDDEDDKPTLSVKPTILYSRKMDVASYNEKELAKLPTEERQYTAIDTFEPFTPTSSRESYFTTLDDMIPEVITLKEGAQVMLKVNHDIPNGLGNGSRGVVLKMYEEKITVKFFNDVVETFEYNGWEMKDKYGKATRQQIPFILAYALTIHKAQGLSLDCAICDLSASVFESGQAYVALSRVRTLDGLYLSKFNPKVLKANAAALEYYRKLDEAEAED